MKPKFILWIGIFLITVLPLRAQQKSQILSDIRLTMQDFMADISNINEEKQYFKENLRSLSQTYSAGTYFMCNGIQQPSFLAWAEEYCTLHLAELPVQHTIDILEHSFQKVDANNKNDKRYRFDATIIRTWSEENQTTDNLSFVVVWNGRDNYASLTEINGRLSTISEMSEDALYAVAAKHLDEGNKIQGVAFLKQAAEKNYIPALNRLGKHYFSERLYDEAFKWLMKGDGTSGDICYMLGWMYENGRGTEKDWWKALEYYEKAVKGEYILANGMVRKLESKMKANNMIYSGKVANEQGQGLNAASIHIQGTDKYYLTDGFGEFTIKGLNKGDKLIFSNLGYEPKELIWEPNIPKSITLKKIAQNTPKARKRTVTYVENKKVVVNHTHGVCKGIVKDSEGKPINMALVNIENTDIKVLTNYWGEYTINGLRPGDSLVFTNPGCRTQKLKWDGQNLNVTLLKETPKIRTINSYSGKLTGYIKDKNTQKGINCALVQIQGTDIKVLTDMNGEFTLKGLKDGDEIIITNIGYKTGSHIWHKPHEKNFWNLFIEKL